MGAGIREQGLVVVDASAEFDDVPALDPGQVIGEFVGPAILPFWPAVAGIAGETGVAGQGEGRQAGDGRVLIPFEPGDSGLLCSVRHPGPGSKRGPVLAVAEADARLVNHVATQVAGERAGDVAGGPGQVAGAKSRK